PFLAGSSRIVLEVDATTAAIPWELLNTPNQHATDPQEPWAVRSQLIRRLRTEVFRQNVLDAQRGDAVLVVGNPTTAPKPYPSLPAAEHEARTVVKVLERQTTLSVYSLLNKDARTIVSELLARPYRVVHIAAHGEPGPDGGVVLSG